MNNDNTIEMKDKILIQSEWICVGVWLLSSTDKNVWSFILDL